jgi:hypothetical protein
VLRLEAACRTQPILTRQHRVQNDELRPPGLNLLSHVSDGLRRAYLVAMSGQEIGDERAQIGIVIDH